MGGFDEGEEETGFVEDEAAAAATAVADEEEEDIKNFKTLSFEILQDKIECLQKTCIGEY